jgi:hypothetical protein
MTAVRWLALLALGSLSCGAVAQDGYTLLVFGDGGSGNAKQRRVAAAMAQACAEAGCDAALVLGDLIYPRGVQSLDDGKFSTHFEQPYPVYSNGLHGDNEAIERYLADVIRDRDVHAYFAGHDHHQEHIAAPLFEQFVQGAATKLRRVRAHRYAEAGQLTQHFARSVLGFAIVELTERTMEVRFFDATDGNAELIYGCRAIVEIAGCVPQ